MENNVTFDKTPVHDSAGSMPIGSGAVTPPSGMINNTDITAPKTAAEPSHVEKGAPPEGGGPQPHGDESDAARSNHKVLSKDHSKSEDNSASKDHSDLKEHSELIVTNTGPANAAEKLTCIARRQPASSYLETRSSSGTSFPVIKVPTSSTADLRTTPRHRSVITKIPLDLTGCRRFQRRQQLSRLRLGSIQLTISVSFRTMPGTLPLPTCRTICSCDGRSLIRREHCCWNTVERPDRHHPVPGRPTPPRSASHPCRSAGRYNRSPAP